MRRITRVSWVVALGMTALSVATGCGGGKGGSGAPGSDAGSSDGGESTSTDASGSTGTDARTGAAADGAGTTGTDAGAMTANDGGGTTGTDSGAMLGGDGAGGVPGGQPGAGTTVSGCQIFPNDNPWNVAIDGPDVEIIHTYDSQLPRGHRRIPTSATTRRTTTAFRTTWSTPSSWTSRRSSTSTRARAIQARVDGSAQTR